MQGAAASLQCPFFPENEKGDIRAELAKIFYIIHIRILIK